VIELCGCRNGGEEKGGWGKKKKLGGGGGGGGGGDDFRKGKESRAWDASQMVVPFNPNNEDSQHI